MVKKKQINLGYNKQTNKQNKMKNDPKGHAVRKKTESVI